MEISQKTYFPVQVRYPGEEIDIRELVQPESYSVKMALSKVYNPSSTPEQNIMNCWDFVCKEIDYPPAGDWHRREAFPTGGFFSRSLVSQSTPDFWSFPYETLSLGIGDCEDTSILLCSMLRNFMNPSEVFVTIGYYGRQDPSLGHAWVTIDRMGQKCVLETTLSEALVSISQVLETSPYFPYHKFNDVLYQEVRSGFVLGAKNKDTKYEFLMNQYSGRV
jgi:hypothetical protein